MRQRARPLVAALFALLPLLSCDGSGGGDRSGANLQVKVNRCPVLTSYTAAPLETLVGSTIELTATAEDPDGDTVRFVWLSNAAGPSEACVGARARYRCVSVGEQRLTVAVTDTRCVSVGMFTVSCTSATTDGCGNGLVENGEDCDDGNLVNLDGCSTTCQREPGVPLQPLRAWGECPMDPVTFGN